MSGGEQLRNTVTNNYIKMLSSPDWKIRVGYSGYVNVAAMPAVSGPDSINSRVWEYSYKKCV